MTLSGSRADLLPVASLAARWLDIEHTGCAGRALLIVTVSKALATFSNNDQETGGERTGHRSTASLGVSQRAQGDSFPSVCGLTPKNGGNNA